MLSPLQKTLHLVAPILMIQTEEEDRLVSEILTSTRKTTDTYVWNPSFGNLPARDYVEEWKRLASPEASDASVLEVLKRAYRTKTNNQGDATYYVILDADEAVLKDREAIRILKDIAISGHWSQKAYRSVVLVSKTGKVPTALEGYVEHWQHELPSSVAITEALSSYENEARRILKDAGQDGEVVFTIPPSRVVGEPYPADVIQACTGLTIYQIQETLDALYIAGDGRITAEDILRRKRAILPSQGFLDDVSSDLSFRDIAGMERLKDWITLAGASFTPEGRAWGLPACKGALLVGVPGCGKSLTAKACGSELGLPVLRFDPGKVFASRVGESEANIRRALLDIEAMSPCVVWIDEIDKGFAGLASSAKSDSGTTARVIGTFLSWYEEHQESVFLIATANGITSLPPELISRFEEIFFVGIPEVEARVECFDIQLRKFWKGNMGSLTGIDVDRLALESQGMTGREIEQVVREGLRSAFVNGGGKPVTKHFSEVLTRKPPLSQVLRDEIHDLISWVSYDPQRDDGVRARFASKATWKPALPPTPKEANVKT